MNQLIHGATDVGDTNPSLCLLVAIVSAEVIHCAFGVVFTFVWLFVGQIVVAGR